MNDAKILFFEGKNVKMEDAPIKADWVVEGEPKARNCVLSRSIDGAATTLLWDCTAGVFNWHYDIDETVYILEGSVIIRDENGVEHILGPGDQALFRAGSRALWRVPNYVHKVAFCRNPLPLYLTFTMGVVRRIKRMLKPGAPVSDAPAMFGGA